MNFLKTQRRFSFLYDGKPISDSDYTVETNENGNIITTIYTFCDGLKVTNVATYYEKFGAYEWVNYFENTSDKPTKIISELWDCDCTFPLPHEEPRKWEARLPKVEEATKIYSPRGSLCDEYEFACDVDTTVCNRRINHIYPDESQKFATYGGRSSNTRAPFFNVQKGNLGLIFAIGWTGQWNCEISRGTDDVQIKTKIEDTYFRLLGGESFRTSSVVILPYSNGLTNAHNSWRRLQKEHFSLIGTVGRDKYGPLCASIWGGMRSSSVIDRINVIKQNNLPYEYVWMDAGWYGLSSPTPDEFEGDWGNHTGDWRISEATHPNKLKDVSEAIHNANKKFLLWFEPERVIYSTPIVQQHPEYFLNDNNPESPNRLLDLGNQDAWNYCYNTIAEIIEELKIDCYRQDFNFDPLEYWRKKDGADRKGITEIKHINGLYKLWDALLERFPHLIIDNCASGGRRLDIEMLRRSIALWRSDYQCPANFDDFITQSHTLNFNKWITYSGSGIGREYDLFRARSAYGASLNVGYSFSERESFGDDPEKMEFIKKVLNEYIKVRPYFSEDFYPLTEDSSKQDVWTAFQFDRPEENDGIIQVFRRAKSPYETANFKLGNIDVNGNYIFTDADDDSSFTLSGKELNENGFNITVKTKRTAKIYFYKKV